MREVTKGNDKYQLFNVLGGDSNFRFKFFSKKGIRKDGNQNDGKAPIKPGIELFIFIEQNNRKRDSIDRFQIYCKVGGKS